MLECHTAAQVSTTEAINEDCSDEIDGGDSGDGDMEMPEANDENEDPRLSAARQNVAGESESTTQESNPNLRITSAEFRFPIPDTELSLSMPDFAPTSRARTQRKCQILKMKEMKWSLHLLQG